MSFTAHDIQVERLEKWLSPTYWTDINIRSVLYHSKVIAPISIVVYEPETASDRPKFIEAKEKLLNNGQKTAIGKSFGPSWFTKWFKVQFSRQEILQHDGMTHDVFSIAFRWDSNSEAMLYLEDGLMVQSFTGGNGADRRDLCCIHSQLFNTIESSCEDDMLWTFYIEMACNGMFGNGNNGMIRPPDENRCFPLDSVELVFVNNEAMGLYYDMQVMYDMAKKLPPSDGQSIKAAAIANRVINQQSLTATRPFSVNQEIKRMIQEEFFDISLNKLDFDVFAVGHCHIDTAWLWTYAETRRKVARSWSTQLQLMEQYPDWLFVASQSVQWEWLKEDYPLLFDRVVSSVEAKRFIPIGGSYTEFDANIPSAESMIRQFLYGQQFFEGELNVQTDVFWLPDTFGYSGQLPQIMRGFNIKYFLSQKLSWNLMNKFPHSTFYWEGIDGSSVLAHFPPADTYNSAGNVEEVMKSYTNHSSKRVTSKALLLYGHGDGGGGVSVAHLEHLTRLQRCKHVPRLHMQTTPSQFFQAVEAQDFQFHSLVKPPPPRWVGELYLELHQGTLTSQGMVKRLNRQCENMMKMVEALLVAAVHCPVHTDVPINDLSRASRVEDVDQVRQSIITMYKDVLLNQFHDVIPGSSIGAVYNDAERMLSSVVQNGQALVDRLLQIILVRLCPSSFSGTTTIHFNPTNFIASSPSKIAPEKQQIPSFGFMVTGYASGKKSTEIGCSGVSCRQLDNGHYLLENQWIKVTVTNTGQVISLLDKRTSCQRELIPSKDSPGNNLMLYEDVPFYWDAWDVFPYHTETETAGRSINSNSNNSSSSNCNSNSTAVIISGMHQHRMAGIEVHFPTIGQAGSAMTQRITIEEDSSMVTFVTCVDWKESHKILKVEFPVLIRSTAAVYEIQHGLVSRPTHGNTPQDAAMFEVCGHRFADLSEPGYGVALLNDCKYGYSCRGSTLCLSLLRSPKSPDAGCDMRKHSFTYCLYPHLGGSVLEGGVVEQAVLLNLPVVTLDTSTDTDTDTGGASLTPSIYYSMFRTKRLPALNDSQTASAVSLVIDVVKLAEKSSSSSSSSMNNDEVIVRCYESAGARGSCLIESQLKLTSVQRCNLKEEVIDIGIDSDIDSEAPPSRVEVIREDTGASCSFVVHYLPFEILTFKINV